MFDYCLLMAVLYFRECGCDIAVMETGLGGRLDSTNALGVPEVAVITRIGYDHMAILGNTLGEIAGEKAGILKPRCKFVMGPQEPEAEVVLLQAAANPENKAQAKTVQPRTVQERNGTQELSISKEQITGLCDKKENQEKGSGSVSIYRVSTDDVERMRSYQLRMLGEYQLENAAIAELTARLLLGEFLALEAKSDSNPKSGYVSDSLEMGSVNRYCASDISRKKQEKIDNIIRKGLEQAVWPGRMQILSESPFLLVDGAHNSNGVAALRRSLEAAFPGEKFHFLMGVMEDKDYTQMVEMMLPLAIDFVTVTPQSQRALAARELAAQIRAHGVPAQAAGSVEEAIRPLFPQAAGSADEALLGLSTQADASVRGALQVRVGRSRTVAFGSLYFIGEL